MAGAVAGELALDLVGGEGEEARAAGGGDPGDVRGEEDVGQAAQRVRDVAAELLDLYSRRAARQASRSSIVTGRSLAD